MLKIFTGSIKPFHYQRRFCTETPFPDRYLASTFKKRHENTEEMPYTYEKTLRYPKTIGNYWKVAEVMQQKRLIPFVHGQNMVWSISQRILKALGYEGCQLLRFEPSAIETSSSITERISAIIKEREAFKENHPIRSRIPFIAKPMILDHTPELRDRLLSVTIGFFHLDRKESPCSFVIGGLYRGAFTWIGLPGNQNVLEAEKCQEIGLRIISKAMIHKGYNEDITHQLLKNVEALYSEAANMPIGQFIVCGVPYNKLHKIVYHCLAGGVPTGIPITEIIDDCSKGLDQGYQARLMFCQEAMNDVQIVNIMDDPEVQIFCKDQKESLQPHQQECLKEILIRDSCEYEDIKKANIHDFYRKIDQVIDEFQLTKK